MVSRPRKAAAIRKAIRTVVGTVIRKAAKGERRTPAATIRDVAARAGVATATVSNVLTGQRHVADDRRRSVLEAVDALGYQPNHLAASLRRQDTRTIGMVVPDLTNPFFAELVHRVEGLAAASGYQILLVDSSNDVEREASRTRALLARRIDGLILVPTRDALPAVNPSGPSLSLPATVLVDRGYGLAGFDTVQSDNADACYRGCRHLLQLGHRDIVFLVNTDVLANIRDRISGYRRALADSGLSAREHVLIGGSSVESCRSVIEQQLRRADRPSAVFAATYDATLGAIKAIRAVDLAFPEDVSLLGFDDFDWMTVLRPYVSTVGQPIDAMAASAWRLLLVRMAGSAGRGANARIRLPCTLQVRESTRPPLAAVKRRRYG
jgi:LacI family transcriptional regulator